MAKIPREDRKVVTTYCVPMYLLDKVEQEAEAKKVSMSEIVRNALAEHFDHGEG